MKMRMPGKFAAVWLLAGSAALAGAQGPAQGGGEMPQMAGMGRMVRGTVTAAATDHLTVKTEQGETYQVAINPNTRVMKGRDPVKLADVHVGDGVGAMGEIDQPNKTVHALFVAVLDAEAIKKAREAMGKTYIAGKITAIDELKLTVLRADGVTQVIAVDEDTSFKKGGRGMQMMVAPSGSAVAPGAGGQGGESITLADVKVGDTIGGPGALKNGVFVPTQLMVGDPSARRRRDGGDGAGDGKAGPK